MKPSRKSRPDIKQFEWEYHFRCMDDRFVAKGLKIGSAGVEAPPLVVFSQIMDYSTATFVTQARLPVAPPEEMKAWVESIKGGRLTRSISIHGK